MTFMIPPTDSSNPITIILRAGLLDITLNGLRVLSNLKIFIAGIFKPDNIISKMLDDTIKKSS